MFIDNRKCLFFHPDLYMSWIIYNAIYNAVKETILSQIQQTVKQQTHIQYTAVLQTHIQYAAVLQTHIKHTVVLQHSKSPVKCSPPQSGDASSV